MTSINLDFSNLKTSLNELSSKFEAYVASLNQHEKIGWILVIVGVLFLIVGTVLW